MKPGDRVSNQASTYMEGIVLSMNGTHCVVHWDDGATCDELIADVTPAFARRSMTSDTNWLQEYDAVARWCAKRGIKGVEGDTLPDMISARVAYEIGADPEAFQKRVRAMSYALAMERLEQEGHV